MISIQTLIGAIAMQCYELQKRNIHAFYEFYPHTSEIEIRVYSNGWSRGEKADKLINIYLDRTGAKDKLINVLDELRNL